MAGAFTGSATGINVTIGAVDATASTFRGVAGRISSFKAQATGLGASLKAAAISALPFVGIAGAIKAAASAFREMSTLTDRADDIGAAAGDLQRLVSVMQQIGARGANIETVSRAMQRMTRETGEVGIEGFARVLGTAAQLGTEAERVDFLMKAFGRNQGLVFAKMIRDGDAGVLKLMEMAEAYPAVSEAAAQAGDRAADAIALAGNTIKAGWWNLLGSLVMGFEEAFGPLPRAATIIGNSIVFVFKAVVEAVRGVIFVLRAVLEPVVRTVTLLIQAVGHLSRAVMESGYSFKDAFKDIGADAQDHFRDYIDGLSEEAGKFTLFRDGFDFQGLGLSGDFTKAKDAAIQGGATFRKNASAAAKEISNAYSKGGSFALKGSNEAAKIIRGSATGTAAQSQRTVTQFLPRIAEGIERTVSGIGDMVSTFDDLEVI